MTHAGDILPFLNAGRMIADGIPFTDFRDAIARVENGECWFDVWNERASCYERAGEAALERGRILSAGQWLWLASLSAHYGQYMWIHEPPLREAGQRRKARLYERAAPYLHPSAERIEVELDGVRLPGYLRLPQHGAPPFSSVVLLGGLESTKEESLLFENLCLDRGLATFAFDGPGQGEVFFQEKLRPDFERYARAVVDELVQRDEIDAERIGILGRSLGGHYALRSAAGDERLRACVAWSVPFDLSDFDAMPAHTRANFLYVSGYADDPEQGREYVRQALDLAGVVGDVRCPVYAQHGRRDILFRDEQLEKLRRGLRNAPLTLDIEDEGDHCCHNMASLVRPRMADWLAEQLARS